MCALNITPYERRYQKAVVELLDGSDLVFTHLDWHTTEQVLASANHLIYLAWQQTTLIGLIGMSLPVNGASWLRLVGLDQRVEPLPVLTALWHVICPQAAAKHTQMICVLQTEEWLAQLLPQLGFWQSDIIITFALDTRTQLPPHSDPAITIRPAFSGDLWTILEVDWHAFSPPWQLSAEDLRQARRLSGNHSVALVNNHIVGYQLSTTYQQHGHLARLAVLPEMQGRGIGAALTTDMIQRFVRRDIWTITVNTQVSNKHSQRLYTRLGFEQISQDLPFWQHEIAAPANESDTT